MTRTRGWTSATRTVASRWPLVGRGPLRDRVATAAEAGGSVLLLGPAGVGKSRVLAAVRESFPGPSLLLQGTPTTSALPLGALVSAFPDLDWLVDRSLAEVRREATARLRSLAGEDQLLLVVDDVTRLDPSTAQGVHEAISRAPWVSVVLTARDDEPLPTAIADTLAEGRLEVVKLRPFEADGIEQLARAYLGGAVDAALVADLRRRSDGLPLAVIELLRGGLELDTIKEDGDVWRATAPLPLHRLGGLVDQRLDRVPPAARAFAELVALAEPLPKRVVAGLTTPDVVHHLEEAGLVAWVDDEGHHRLVMAHPLYAELLRDGLPPERRREALGRLADAFEQVKATRETPLRLALWRLESGGGSSVLFQNAARRAYGAGDFDLAVRFAQRAQELGGGYHASMALGASLVELGDTEAGLRHLRSARSGAQRPLEVAWSAIAVSHTQWTALARVDLAIEELDRVARSLTDADAVADVEAYRAVVLGAAGDVPAVRSVLANGVGRSPRSRFLLRTAAALAADELPTDAVIREHLETHEDDPVLRRGLPIGRTVQEVASLLIRDDLAEVTALARHRHGEVLLDGEAHEVAWWSAALGRLLLRSGQIAAARAQLRDAELALEAVDTLRWRPAVRCLLAHGFVLSGEPTAARAILATLQEERDRSHRVRAWAATVEAEAVALERGVDDGVAAAVDAGDRAVSLGRDVTATVAWEIAVRLGQGAAVAERLRGAERRTGYRHARNLAAAAAALARDDAAGLDTAARDLARSGRRLVAACVARLGAERSADPRTDALAAGLWTTCRGADLPILAGVDAVVLAPRARAIARRVSDGATSQEVADGFGVSIRTVDNQLGRVYRRLGVRGRRELAAIYPADTPPLADPPAEGS